MKKFKTKFDMVPYRGTVMNPYDAVDRLSYVDSTTQIVEMMKAGVSAKLRRAQLIGDETDLNAPATPVYAPDIAVAYKQLHELQDQLKENQRLKAEKFKAEYEKKLAAMQSPVKGTISDLPSST